MGEGYKSTMKSPFKKLIAFEKEYPVEQEGERDLRLVADPVDNNETNNKLPAANICS
jgi:hypothetical protein